MSREAETITKRDLVVDISNSLGLTQHQVFSVIQSFIEHVTEDLANGNEVVLCNFGTFEVIETKAKVGRNPRQPDKEVTIPPRKVVKFRPGKELKQEVAKLLTPVRGARMR